MVRGKRMQRSVAICISSNEAKQVNNNKIDKNEGQNNQEAIFAFTNNQLGEPMVKPIIRVNAQIHGVLDAASQIRRAMMAGGVPAPWTPSWPAAARLVCEAATASRAAHSKPPVAISTQSGPENLAWRLAF